MDILGKLLHALEGVLDFGAGVPLIFVGVFVILLIANACAPQPTLSAQLKTSTSTDWKDEGNDLQSRQVAPFTVCYRDSKGLSCVYTR